MALALFTACAQSAGAFLGFEIGAIFLMRIAVQMDPIDKVDIEADTTFAMIEEAQRRGFAVSVYQPEHLVYDRGNVYAMAQPVRVRRVKGDHVDFSPRVALDLRQDVDLVLMRQDPPFDMAYLTFAHVLELVAEDTLVLNDPAAVRSAPEKVSPLLFPELMPPSMIARSAEEAKRFRAEVGDVIVKPLNRNGGANIFRIKPDDRNFDALLEMFFEISREPVMIQAFLPGVADGDKRIILVDGEVVGAINRVPPEGAVRANLHVGGVAAKTDLTRDDQEICRKIGPWLKDQGLVFVGIDVIAGKLTEINVTSPTGVQELKRLSGVDACAAFWDAVERRLDDR